jgi:hypothetical protein
VRTSTNSAIAAILVLGLLTLPEAGRAEPVEVVCYSGPQRSGAVVRHLTLDLDGGAVTDRSFGEGITYRVEVGNPFSYWSDNRGGRFQFNRMSGELNVWTGRAFQGYGYCVRGQLERF